MSTIYSIGKAVPPYKSNQDDIYSFMKKQIASPTNERLLKTIYAHSQIETRYSVIPDYSCAASDRVFYPSSENLEPFPNLETRLDLYNKFAPELGLAAANDCVQRLNIKPAITHLITVSCTGMSAPGLDIELVHRLGLSSDVNRTSINFMGCYAVFHALKIADSICKSESSAIVLIVSVELCTLHFQKEENMDNMLSNSLFGDGAGAILVAADGTMQSKGIKINSFYSDIAANGSTDMAWSISSKGFQMTLTTYVPELIKKGMGRLIERLPHNMFNGAASSTQWAIHPGGRKILEATRDAFGIKNEKLEASYTVLRNYGNMSSASVIFVLKELWDHSLNWQKPETIFSAGYGPGLTIESALMETIDG